MASLRRLSRAYPYLRSLSRSRFYATSTSSSLSASLATAAQQMPLKYAVKYVNDPKSTFWTNHELNSHVCALAAGLAELDLINAKIVTVLPPASPEYCTLLIAASKVSATIIPAPVSSDITSIDELAELEKFIELHQPAALFLGKEYDLKDAPAADGIFAGVQSIMHALDPNVATSDAAGRDGFAPLTGKPFQSEKFPYLRTVIHTSDVNLRGCTTFKSLLLYNGAQRVGTPATTVLTAPDGELSEQDGMAKASNLNETINLSSDHGQKQGKLVISPGITTDPYVAMLAAISNGALWINPGVQDPKKVAQDENASLV